MSPVLTDIVLPSLQIQASFQKVLFSTLKHMKPVGFDFKGSPHWTHVRSPSLPHFPPQKTLVVENWDTLQGNIDFDLWEVPWKDTIAESRISFRCMHLREILAMIQHPKLFTCKVCSLLFLEN